MAAAASAATGADPLKQQSPFLSDGALLLPGPRRVEVAREKSAYRPSRRREASRSGNPAAIIRSCASRTS